MRAIASTTFTVGAPWFSSLAFRLGDEDRDAACGLRLILLVRRIGRDGQLPEPRALLVVGDLAHAHRLHDGEVAQLDVRVRAQVVDPDRVARRAADGADEDVVAAV